MTFLHPEFIYLMMPVIFILFYFLLTQADQMHQFFSAEVVERLRVDSNRMSLRVRNILFFAMFIFLVLALAFPVIEEGKVKVQAKHAKIMIALDISDSMLAEDVYPSRIALAKEKLLTLLDKVPTQRIGVMAFATDAYLVAPLTFDHRAVRFLVEQLRPSLITEKGTDIMGLLHATSAVMKAQDEMDLLLISDGGEQRAFTQEIAYAKARGITIYVLSVGTEQGAPIKDSEGTLVTDNSSVVITRRNSAIAELATKSGGSLIESVTGERDVVAMIKEISGKSAEETPDEEKVTQFIPLFYLPLSLAMLLLMIATSSMSKRERLQMPGVFLLGYLLMSSTPSHAGLMDFRLLQEARQSYEAGEYAHSARLYGTYARESGSDEARYDQANALYRSGKYEAAARAYEKVAFLDRHRRFDTLHNLGNAYARQGNILAYRKAVTAYERALQIKEDVLTRENQDQVKARIMEASSSRSKPDRKSSRLPLKMSGHQESAGQARAVPGAGDTSSIAKSKGAIEEKRAQSKAQTDRQKESVKGVLSEDDAEEAIQKKSSTYDVKSLGHSATQSKDKTAMSDTEERKWFKVLERQPISHIYKIETTQIREEKRDAKPW